MVGSDGIEISARVSFDAVAAAYDTFMGRCTRLYLPALLAAANLVPGQRVLDVATGTGESAAMAVAAVGPTGQVVGVDISLPMLRGARAKYDGIPLAAMDGQSLAGADGSFDAALCQLGLMFFPEPLAGLRECRRVLLSGARFAASVWSVPERVPWVGVLAMALAVHLPERREELLRGSSLSDPAHLTRLLADAGFTDVAVTRETQSLLFASFDAYWSVVESGAIRIGLMLRELREDARRGVMAEVHVRLARFESGGQLKMPSEALVVAGRR